MQTNASLKNKEGISKKVPESLCQAVNFSLGLVNKYTTNEVYILLNL